MLVRQPLPDLHLAYVTQVAVSDMSIMVQEAVVSTSNWPSISTCSLVWPTQAPVGNVILPVSQHPLKPGQYLLGFRCASITVQKVLSAFEVAPLQPFHLLPGDTSYFILFPLIPCTSERQSPFYSTTRQGTQDVMI